MSVSTICRSTMEESRRHLEGPTEILFPFLLRLSFTQVQPPAESKKKKNTFKRKTSSESFLLDKRGRFQITSIRVCSTIYLGEKIDHVWKKKKLTCDSATALFGAFLTETSSMEQEMAQKTGEQTFHVRTPGFNLPKHHGPTPLHPFPKNKKNQKYFL